MRRTDVRPISNRRAISLCLCLPDIFEDVTAGLPPMTLVEIEEYLVGVADVVVQVAHIGEVVTIVGIVEI
jgi:hypothetical protein